MPFSLPPFIFTTFNIHPLKHFQMPIAHDATIVGISGKMTRDLMAETNESRFGLVYQLPHRIEWLTDNGPAYTTHDTWIFALSLGLSVCMTPVQSTETTEWRKAS
jgi:hypothetical protein